MKTALINHPWIIILAVFLAILFAFIYYYKDPYLKNLSKKWLFLMALLRALAVFFITILLADIFLKTTSFQIQKPTIVWLQDNSKSIKLALNQNELNTFQNSARELFQKLNKKYQLNIYTFGQNLKNNSKFSFSEQYTNISQALSKIAEQYYNQNLSAVILVTDGIYNLGFNPLYLAPQLPFPVYTILLGDTTTYADVKISNLLTNNIVYYQNMFPVQVDVSAVKAKGATVRLNIFLNHKLVKSQTFTITSNNFSKTFNFYLKSSKIGQTIITATVTTLPNEHNKANNSQSTVINVINTKEKILFLANFPHPDIAAMRRALETDPNFKTYFFLADKFHKKFTDYNLIVLVQIPTKNINSSRLLKQIQQAKLPVLFICGNKCNFYKLNQLNLGLNLQVFPDQFNEATPILNQNFSLFIPPNGLNNLCKNLPPLIVPFGQIKFSAKANTIMFQQIKNIQTKQPLISIIPSSPFNNNKIGIIFGEGIWRWPMAEFKNTSSFSSTYRLIQQIVQYLTVNAKKQRFIVKVKNIIPQAQPVIFTAQLFDQTYTPVTKPNVNLKIIDSAKNTYNFTFDKRSNYYYLNIGTLQPGTYKFTASTSLGKEVFTQTGSFTVKKVNIEALNLKANLPLLQSLAKKTGGKQLFANQIQSLPNILSQNPNIKPVSYPVVNIANVISHKWLLFIIVLLLGLEWFLRKFFGSF